MVGVALAAWVVGEVGVRDAADVVRVLFKSSAVHMDHEFVFRWASPDRTVGGGRRKETAVPAI